MAGAIATFQVTMDSIGAWHGFSIYEETTDGRGNVGVMSFDNEADANNFLTLLNDQYFVPSTMQHPTWSEFVISPPGAIITETIGDIYERQRNGNA